MTPLSRLPKVRSERIMAAARGQQCSLRLPGICNFNDMTTVAAHLPGIGKGTGTKVSDLHVAFACSACHDALDRQTFDRFGLTPASVWMAALRGHCETQARLVEMGLINVPDAEVI